MAIECSCIKLDGIVTDGMSHVDMVLTKLMFISKDWPHRLQGNVGMHECF